MDYGKIEKLLINGGRIRKKDWGEGKNIEFYEESRTPTKDGPVVSGVFYITPNGKPYRKLKDLLNSEGIALDSDSYEIHI